MVNYMVMISDSDMATKWLMQVLYYDSMLKQS